MPADIICLDLEDSVPEDQKPKARGMAAESLGESHEGRKFVRTNSPQSGEIPKDLEVIMRDGLDGIVIPKVDSPQQLQEIIAMLKEYESRLHLPKTLLIPSIESALGTVNCYNIASCSERVEAVVFGVFDLLDDLYTEYEPGSPAAAYARSKIPLDARAAKVPAIDAIWQDTKDNAGLWKMILDSYSFSIAISCSCCGESTFGITIPSKPSRIITSRSFGISPDWGEFVRTNLRPSCDSPSDSAAMPLALGF